MYFANKTSADGAIIHRGDNLTGEGSVKTDDEVIEVDLTRVNDKVQSIWAVITVFTTGK